mmetsp:Transcript_20929/g.36015  ORF Transcript_20929/g.36015 Transcript_20929/m.36015 type:complete len:90 (-) Transcript_20929:1236-1505(-)
MKIHGGFGRYGCATFDQNRHQSSISFSTQAEGGNIEQHQVFDGIATCTAENASLDGGAGGNGFVRVDALTGFFAIEIVFYKLLYLGYTR